MRKKALKAVCITGLIIVSSGAWAQSGPGGGGGQGNGGPPGAGAPVDAGVVGLLLTAAGYAYYQTKNRKED